MPYHTLINTSDLAAHLDSSEWVLVDCRFSLDDTERGRQEYLREHVPGAVYAHLGDDLSGPVIEGKTGRHPLPVPEIAAEAFGALGIADGMQVVAYDDVGGGIASRLWWMLRYLGHDETAVLDGGWLAWKDEDRPVRSGAEHNEARSFTPRVRAEWAVDADRVDHIRSDSDWLLMDARDEVRYRGEFEPIDRVAGHIPGAKSVPFKENLDENGRFRSAEELRNRFATVLGSTPPSRVVSHCGSGVTACSNILAMEHAGLSGSRLYPGSWSEWITNPEHPVETATGEPAEDDT